MLKRVKNTNKTNNNTDLVGVVTYKRSNKPRCNFSVVMVGFLITSSLLTCVSGGTSIVNAQTIEDSSYVQMNQNSSSLLDATIYDIEQVRASADSGHIDVEALKGIFEELSQIERYLNDEEAASDKFITLLSKSSVFYDEIADLSRYTMNGDLATAKYYYDSGVDVLNKLKGRITFKDVPASSWYYSDVKSVTSRGIINGKGNGLFHPDGTLTVAEAIKLAAVINAQYNGDIIPESVTHWADSYFSYAEGVIFNKGDFSAEEFDTPITRRSMAYLFANALPDKEYKKINNDNLLPEKTSDENVLKLYRAGILIGDTTGFRLNDTISRAETAAIINRLVDVTARKVVSVIPEPKVAPRVLYVAPVDQGLQKISESPFEGSQSIRVLYNHTYNCNNQEEYDAVINAVKEACNAVLPTYEPSKYIKQYLDGEMSEEEYGRRAGNSSVLLALGDNEELKAETLKILDRRTQVYNYLKENYIYKKEIINSEQIGITAYDELFGNTGNTCEAAAALNSAIWDAMGYNSVTYNSNKSNHAGNAVLLNDLCILKWSAGFQTYDEVKKISPDLAVHVNETFSDRIYGNGLLVV